MCREGINYLSKQRRQSKKPQRFQPPKKSLPREDRELLEYTPEAFCAFFERFSGLGAVPDHAKSWVASAMREDNLVLNVPSKHAKTTIMAEWFTIWSLARDRQAQILLISKTQPLAVRSARRIAQIIENNADLIDAYGWFRPEDGSWPWRPEAGELMVAGRDRVTGTGDFSLQARGSQQQVLGMEASLLIADDITDRAIAQSEANSKRELEWFRGECLSRLVGDGKAILIGQRVHARDIYGTLLADEEDVGEERTWFQETYPAILGGDLLKDEDDEIKLLWPVPRAGTPNPLRWLRNQRKRLGAEMFDAYFQQKPWPEGQAGIRDEWIQGCLDHNRPLGTSQFKPEERVRVISVDPSPSRYAGIIVADVVEGVQPVIHILEARRELDIGIDGLLRVLADLQLKYGANCCIVEMNSLRIIAKDSIYKQLQELFSYRLIPHKTTATSKQHETLGLWTMGSAWEFGRIRLPYGDPAAQQSSDLLIREALGFIPTTDLVMAAWFIFYNLGGLMMYRLGAMPTRMRWAEGSSWGSRFSDRRVSVA